MRRFLLAAAATALSGISNATPHPDLASRQGAVRIMALGDSITGSPGCWRALLWRNLQNAGITNTDFVGSLAPQGCGFTYDGENEGHGGILATNIVSQNQLPPWLSSARPDIVMMHLGTNDVWSNISPQRLTTAFGTLVDQMRASKASMKILVAKIIPMNPSNCADCNQRVIALNSAIEAWAPTKSTSASPITVVDCYTGFNTATDTGDGVHPNEAGNVKLANCWYNPLVAAIRGGTTPTSTTLRPSSTTTATPSRTSTTPIITTTTSGSPPAQTSNVMCAARWGQCGGQNWTGPTCCQSGSTCQAQNQWYSQCL